MTHVARVAYVALSVCLSCSSGDARETNQPVTTGDSGDAGAPPVGLDGSALVDTAATVDGMGAEDSGPDAHAGTACTEGLAGPELVFIPASDTAAFCIDAHEVKQREYAEFIEAAMLNPPEQTEECAWNQRFDPIPVSGEGSIPPGSCLRGTYDPVNRAEYSMTCVDWCDAKAYCEWAGKRLCGGLGELDETIETKTDPTVSEWQFACTSGGLLPYPYGAEYIAGLCVDDNFATPAVGGGSTGSPECTGSEPSFSAVTDLVGSVREWTTACEETQDTCSTQGGYYGDTEASCGSTTQAYRRETPASVGIRCCADAV